MCGRASQVAAGCPSPHCAAPLLTLLLVLVRSYSALCHVAGTLLTNTSGPLLFAECVLRGRFENLQAVDAFVANLLKALGGGNLDDGRWT